MITSITKLQLVLLENSFEFVRVFKILFGEKYVRVRNYATEIRHFSPLFLLLCRYLNSFSVAAFLALFTSIV